MLTRRNTLVETFPSGVYLVSQDDPYSGEAITRPSTAFACHPLRCNHGRNDAFLRTMRTGTKGVRAEILRSRNGVPRADTSRRHARGVRGGSPIRCASRRRLAGERALAATWAARVAVRVAADWDAAIVLAERGRRPPVFPDGMRLWTA